MSVFRNLDCLSLFVYSNTTLLELPTLLFLFFSKISTSKLGVRLIYGCGLYTDIYGNSSRLIYVNTRVISLIFIFSIIRTLDYPDYLPRSVFLSQINFLFLGFAHATQLERTVQRLLYLFAKLICDPLSISKNYH